METTPDAPKAALPDNILKALGFKIETDPYFPLDYFAFVQFPDFSTKTINRAPGEIACFPDGDDITSIAQHAYKLSNIEIDDKWLAKMPHFEDELRDARLRAFERAYVGKPISTTDFGTSTLRSKEQSAATAEDILADITRVYNELKAKKREDDKNLIRACMKAGFIVSVSEGTDRPALTMPEDAREAYREVVREMIADRTVSIRNRYTT